jgi:hypothetical protein
MDISIVLAVFLPVAALAIVALSWLGELPSECAACAVTSDSLRLRNPAVLVLVYAQRCGSGRRDDDPRVSVTRADVRDVAAFVAQL